MTNGSVELELLCGGSVSSRAAPCSRTAAASCAGRQVGDNPQASEGCPCLCACQQPAGHRASRRGPSLELSQKPQPVVWGPRQVPGPKLEELVWGCPRLPTLIVHFPWREGPSASLATLPASSRDTELSEKEGRSRELDLSPACSR